MQEDPEKTVGNYNEFADANPPIILPKGALNIQTTEAQQALNHQEIVRLGIDLVNNKVNEIFGGKNKLTAQELAFPKIKIIDSYPQNSNWAGYFSSNTNEITLVMDKISNDTRSRTKVFIHEYIHFLSHNGHDSTEQVNETLRVAQNNNVGFRRDFGLDIRKDKEDKMTSDYFLTFNEAVTEQLAIDILPGVHETYSDYRGLLNQVIDDAVVRKLGSKDENGIFISWSKEQFKIYIYACFFKGDLNGFTRLLKTVYEKYSISEQQFGLMTNRSDLPSVIEKDLQANSPGNPPPAPSRVAILVQERLNSKTAKDYITNIIGPGPDHGGDNGNTYGAQYDAFIEENRITSSSKVTLEGKEYLVDNQGFFVYHGEDSSRILNYIKGELDNQLVLLKRGETNQTHITQHIDSLLFDKYRMSMISDGFRDFYIYKHTKME